MSCQGVADLVDYGLTKGLLREEDRIYVTNRLLAIMQMDSYEETAPEKGRPLEEILAVLLGEACRRGICRDSVTARDLFDTRLMDALLDRPARIVGDFYERYKISPREATDAYYRFAIDSDYIREYRVKKDIKWVCETKYGPLDITINLSKPEKDPESIAAERLAGGGGYPKCLLCKENTGYGGRANHPSRANHRPIPLVLDNKEWYFQYSPYVYYNEHCILFNGEHVPMKIDRSTFVRLLEFIRKFPHYMAGSNGDLPIVGGSILSHDHLQGGRYEFAMAKAPIEIPVSISGFGDVPAGIVRWPMSVLRLSSPLEERLVELADRILSAWRLYTDEEAGIFAETNGEPHNTITPIARKRGDFFELDLVLRNNRTTPERPDGLFHPRRELHHIKKENIGLIEVMGLAILPGRLKAEMAALAEEILTAGAPGSSESTAKHKAWGEAVMKKHPALCRDTIDGILREELGLVFLQVLEDAAVFPCRPEGREAFLRFIRVLSAR